MKNSVKNIFLMASIFFVVVSCQNQKNKDTSNTTSSKPEVAIERPSLDKTEDSIIIRDQNKAALEKVMKTKEKITNEATQAILETQNAIKLLSKNDAVDAINKLENVKTQIEKVTNKYPNLDLIPVDINVRSNDLISDINTVKQITKDAESALKKGHLQEARKLLSGLSSEMDITIVNIPVGIYPKEIDKAIHLIGLNKFDEAKSLLISTINELVTVQEVLPIPILKAEAMLNEAAQRYLEDRTQNKKVVINLLDNAKYQLEFAKALGYGNQDKVFTELDNEIKNLKKSVGSKTDSKDLFTKVKSKLKNFKEKTF
ncbi:YfdX family protein [Lutibacter sp.]|uniref:YfdX family protein n=1 Tax=Lutibacter sp. TaxID=1925666 RepID=UPI0025B88992|nr:YfdX family protein [Lutibacter sp.]MCF6182352.1 YfdX family protein [Lutibacter sp.]